MYLKYLLPTPDVHAYQPHNQRLSLVFSSTRAVFPVEVKS